MNNLKAPVRNDQEDARVFKCQDEVTPIQRANTISSLQSSAESPSLSRIYLKKLKDDLYI